MKPIRIYHSLVSAALCLLTYNSAWSLDAVTVDAQGNATFAKAVKAPNITGFTSLVNITGTTVLPTDGSIAGKLYKISGVTADYTITLPSAASVTAGSVVSFSVATSNLANKQYLVAPFTGQSIEGRTQGLILVHTNYIALMSDGVSEWMLTTKKVDTDWVYAGTAQITASGGGLYRSEPAQVDYLLWRREGDTIEIRWLYAMLTNGDWSDSKGNGNYQISIPIGTPNYGAITNGMNYLPGTSLDAKYGVSIGTANYADTYGYGNWGIGIPCLYAGKIGMMLFLEHGPKYYDDYTTQYFERKMAPWSSEWGPLDGYYGVTITMNCKIPMAGW